MFRFSLGLARMDRFPNEYIRGTARVGHFGDKIREARLRWFGLVQRRDSEYICGKKVGGKELIHGCVERGHAESRKRLRRTTTNNY